MATSIENYISRLKKVQEKKKKIRALEEKQKLVRLAAKSAGGDHISEEAPTIFDDFRDPDILFD